jgi:ATP-dependent Clp protease ATP-binding subunit ClpC
MIERFTEHARRVLVIAQQEAVNLNHPHVGTEHFLLGLIGERVGIGAKALASFGVSDVMVREKVQEIHGVPTTTASGSPPFTRRAKEVLELSLRQSLLLGHSSLGTEHLLLGIAHEGQGVASQILIQYGVGMFEVRDRVFELLLDHGEVP